VRRGSMERCGAVMAAVWAAVVVVAAQGSGTVHRVTVQGTELAWVEQGSGTPVVFVHGSGADLRTWGYQMGPVAQASFRAVAYSRRFHHPNAPPAEGEAYTAALQGADLAAFIESLHAGAVHIVASSYGGVVALLAARDRPALIRTLALTEPAMLSLVPPGSQAAADVAALQTARSLISRGEPDNALRAFVDAVFGAGAYGLIPTSTREMLTDNLPELRREAAAPPWDPPFTCDDARAVKAPVLLVTGGSSRSFFKAIDERLAECLPRVEPVTVPGASHAVHAQQTARFNELLVAFLTRHREEPSKGSAIVTARRSGFSIAAAAVSRCRTARCQRWPSRPSRPPAAGR
jgi:non-heme chloroperoxidase